MINHQCETIVNALFKIIERLTNTYIHILSYFDLKIWKSIRRILLLSIATRIDRSDPVEIKDDFVLSRTFFLLGSSGKFQLLQKQEVLISQIVNGFAIYIV